MKKFLTLALALVMVLSLSAPAFAADGEFEEMNWSYTCSAAENTYWAQMGNDFGNMVNEATGGAVTVTIYPSDQLTSGNQVDGIQAVIDGTIDMSAHSNIIYSNIDQRLNVISLPFLFSSFDDVDAKLDGEAGEAVGALVEDLGLHLLGIAENGFRQITNNVKPIESVADMAGLKIRTPNSQLLNREYELWGANYSNANWNEVYTGLQTGTYDGQENPLSAADGSSIQEVQKYCTYWSGVYDCIFFTMNKALYDSLSPELQEIVDEAGKKAAQNQRDLQRADEEHLIEKWEEAGVEFTYLTDEAAEEFREVASPCYDEFAEIVGQDLLDLFTAPVEGAEEAAE